MTQGNTGYKMKVEYNLTCYLCGEFHSGYTDMDLPEWDVCLLQGEHCLCNKCIPVYKFFEDQCAGCVASNLDCNLNKSIKDESLSEMQLETIAKGKCPVRINGTRILNTGSGDTQQVDLSENSVEAGVLLVNRIKEIWLNP
jgi:hypothetical protein